MIQINKIKKEIIKLYFNKLNIEDINISSYLVNILQLSNYLISQIQAPNTIPEIEKLQLSPDLEESVKIAVENTEIQREIRVYLWINKRLVDRIYSQFKADNLAAYYMQREIP